MGFLPSGTWRERPVDKVFAAQALDRDEIEPLLREMRRLSLSAFVVVPDGSVLAALAGVSDNTSGLLFPGPTTSPPILRERLPTGEELVFVERVASRVYFYETS